MHGRFAQRVDDAGADGEVVLDEVELRRPGGGEVHTVGVGSARCVRRPRSQSPAPWPPDNGYAAEAAPIVRVVGVRRRAVRRPLAPRAAARSRCGHRAPRPDPGDGQAEPGTSRGAVPARVGGGEAVEGVVGELGREPRTLVDHVDGRRRAGDDDLHVRPLRRVADGVVDEIADHPADRRRVAVDGEPAGRLKVQRHLAGRGGRAECLDGVVRQLRHPGRRRRRAPRWPRVGASGAPEALPVSASGGSGWRARLGDALADGDAVLRPPCGSGSHPRCGRRRPRPGAP